VKGSEVPASRGDCDRDGVVYSGGNLRNASVTEEEMAASLRSNCVRFCDDAKCGRETIERYERRSIAQAYQCLSPCNNGLCALFAGNGEILNEFSN